MKQILREEVSRDRLPRFATNLHVANLCYINFYTLPKIRKAGKTAW